MKKKIAHSATKNIHYLMMSWKTLHSTTVVVWSMECETYGGRDETCYRGSGMWQWQMVKHKQTVCVWKIDVEQSHADVFPLLLIYILCRRF